jgi:hypothetical protein
LAPELPASIAGQAGGGRVDSQSGSDAGADESRIAEGWQLLLVQGVARHALFIAVLAIGATVRIVYMNAYPSIFMVDPDSLDYLRAAADWTPNATRPFAYSLILSLMSPTHDLTWVAVVQHVTGVVLAISIYVWLCRRGVRRWLATLAAAPVLLDAGQISLEHYVMAETLFTVLIVAFVLLLLRRKTPGIGTAVGAGVLLAAAGLTRTVGLPLFFLALGYLLVRRSGWRACAGFAGAFLIPLAGYAVWFHGQYGVYGFSQNPSLILYGRVAQIVDCDRLTNLTPRERRLCPAEPLGQRHAADWYWLVGSERRALQFAPDDPVFASFDHKVMLAQFGDLAWQWAKEMTFFFRVASPDDRVTCLSRMWVPLPGDPTRCGGAIPTRPSPGTSTAASTPTRSMPGSTPPAIPARRPTCSGTWPRPAPRRRRCCWPRY